MKIYLACALTHVPESDFGSYTKRLHRIAYALKDGDRNRVRYALMDSDPQLAEKPPKDKPKLCYLWDRRMVEESDVIVAEATYPSVGLGIEMQIAETKDIPIIICFERSEARRSQAKYYENPDHHKHQLQIGDGFISLMALGLPNVFSVIPYAKEADCIHEIQRKLGVLDERKP